MGGLDIVARDKEGKVKKDIHISRDKIKGKKVSVDTLKEEELKTKETLGE